MTQISITLKELQERTNAPIYLIQYLKSCQRLPIVKKSKGRGYPTHYDEKAIAVVKEHMDRGDNNDKSR